MRFKVLTLNIMGDGTEIARLIRCSEADIVGLQEVSEFGADIARTLGFHFQQQGADVAVISRFPIDENWARRDALIRIADDKKIIFHNRHFSHHPYQPYQLLGIPYGDQRFILTEAEARSEAKKARGGEVLQLIKDIEMSGDIPAILTMDANEPSHLDWTAAAAAARRHPIKVVWPTTKAITDAGFTDAYREMSPDEIVDPGYTWTPTTKCDDPKDHHDRIDFVFYRGSRLRAVSVDIVGEAYGPASIVYSPYPTDHRGVLVEFQLD